MSGVDGGRFEVEAKVVLMVPGGLRDRLRRLGAEPSGTTRQEDAYFQHPGRDLAASDEALRVRREGPEAEASGAASTPTQWTMTYKGPRLPQETKARVEHDVPAGVDPSPLLEALGFVRAAAVGKTRESWRLRDLVVAIDAVDGLGSFAEVEALDDDPAAAGARVEAALKELGLAGAERVEASYLELALAAGATS